MSEREELREQLTRVRRRWSTQVRLAAAGRMAAAAAAPLLVGALAWQIVQPSGWPLAILALGALAAAGAAALLARGARSAPPDDRQIARFIEERWSEAGVASGPGDVLVSAVQVAGASSPAGPFDELILSRAIARLRTIDPSDVVTRADMRRAAARALIGTGVLMAAGLVAGPFFGRAAADAALALFPHAVRVTVVTGDTRVPAGQPLRIGAIVEGKGARWLPAAPSLIVSAGAQQQAVAMVQAGDTWTYTFESIDRSFEYRVTAGAAASDTYAVTALFPPRVTRIDLHYRYPAFTRLPVRTEEDGGDIYAPAGTEVRVLVHTDRPGTSGALALASGAPVPLSSTEGPALSGDLMLARDDRYRVRLVDGDGLESSGDVEYFIRLMADRPPDVRITRPSADQGITPLQEVIIEARADDDHGIAAFDLVYTVAGREPRTVPFTSTAGTPAARTGTYLLETEALDVQPGDIIAIHARARDVPRGRRSMDVRSDIFFLEVKPFGEEFTAAESQAMGGGAGSTQIDALIAVQKEIISATWNLERRSGAGRSADDLHAVAQAQAELRARTEKMRGNARGAPRQGVPAQQVRMPPGPRRIGTPDHVAAAAEAMAVAAEHLGAQRTADAIPHEMAALRALLHAQAEVRRRQVLQQAAGGGGSGRADRDLSALFDRELQRQQGTRYETPPPPQSSEPEESSDIADRLRDLARRQEDLARRQRELEEADGEPAARQLARLSREQQELRGRMDDLVKAHQGAPQPRNTGASGGAQGENGSGTQASGGAAGRRAAATGGSGAETMTKAADAVREAARAAGSPEARGGAAAAERAAEALRQAERDARGQGNDARRRLAEQLQLEAQQVTTAQRRVASDVQRLTEGEQAPSWSADARTRLADQKDRLAARVEALERNAADLARAAPGREGAPFAEAARQLQTAAIGKRMREGAQALRGGAATDAPPFPGRAHADTETQLAAALARVVEALRGEPASDVDEVASAFERTRAMRDALDRLERQLRDAEARLRAAGGDAGGDAGGEETPVGGRQQGRVAAGAGERAAAEEALRAAREEYGRELQRARTSLGGLEGGLGGTTPEHHEFSRSAPGTEAFKQDFSEWEVLRKDLDLALEQYESAAAARLKGAEAGERLSAGESDRVPDQYRSMVSRYFRSLAGVKR